MNHLRCAAIFTLGTLLVGCSGWSIAQKQPAHTPLPVRTEAEQPDIVKIETSIYRVKLSDQSAVDADWGMDTTRTLMPQDGSPVKQIFGATLDAPDKVFTVSKKFAETEILAYLNKSGEASLISEATNRLEEGTPLAVSTEDKASYAARMYCVGQNDIAKFSEMGPGMIILPKVTDENLLLRLSANYTTLGKISTSTEEQSDNCSLQPLSHFRFSVQRVAEDEALVMSGIQSVSATKDKFISVVVIKASIVKRH